MQRRPRKWLTHALARPPFRDEAGRKRFLERITRAPAHIVRQLQLTIPDGRRPRARCGSRFFPISIPARIPATWRGSAPS